MFAKKCGRGGAVRFERAFVLSDFWFSHKNQNVSPWPCFVFEHLRNVRHTLIENIIRKNITSHGRFTYAKIFFDASYSPFHGNVFHGQPLMRYLYGLICKNIIIITCYPRDNFGIWVAHYHSDYFGISFQS